LFDEIINVVEVWIKDNPIHGMWVCVFILGMFITFCFSMCGKPDKPKPKVTTSQTKEETPPKKITYNFNIKGNGILTFQGTDYKIEELRDFDIEVNHHIDVELSWVSDNDQPIIIELKGNGEDRLSKTWSSTKGTISFNSGATQCFIIGIRPGWL